MRLRKFWFASLLILVNFLIFTACSPTDSYQYSTSPTPPSVEFAEPKQSMGSPPTQSPVPTTPVPTPESIGASTPTTTPTPTNVPKGSLTPFGASAVAILETEVVTPPPFIPGGQVWAAVYTGGLGSSGAFVHPTGDGGFIVLGRFINQSNDFNPWLLKISGDGGIEWQETFTNIYESALYETPTGSIVLIGNESLVKLKPDGTFDSQKTYSRPESQLFYPMIGYLREIQPEADGGVLALSIGNIVSKLDAEGDLIWQRIIPGETYSSDGPVSWVGPGSVVSGSQTGRNGFSIQRQGIDTASWQLSFAFSEKDVPTLEPLFIQGTQDGGVFFAGSLYAYTGLGGADTWFVRLSQSGEVIWQTILPVWEGADIQALETRDGGFLVTFTTSRVGGQDPVSPNPLRLLRFDPQGNLTWDRLFGQKQVRPTITGIAETQDGSYILVGSLSHLNSTQVTTSKELLILRLDSNGDIPGCDWIKENPFSGAVVPSPSSNRVSMDRIAAEVGEFSSWEGGFRPFEIETSEAYILQLCVTLGP